MKQLIVNYNKVLPVNKLLGHAQFNMPANAQKRALKVENTLKNKKKKTSKSKNCVFFQKKVKRLKSQKEICANYITVERARARVRF